jgi:hypothetical protein
MSRAKMLPIRLTDEEYELLKAYADAKNLSMAEVVRDCIKRLKLPKST